MRVWIAAAALLVLAGTAEAKTYSMTCTNPHGPYLVVYDDTARTLILNPDSDRAAYGVAVVLPPPLMTVIGDVPKQGDMAYVATLTDKPSMIYYVHGAVAQTDTCTIPIVDLGL
jgi:hypothetical protein